MNNLNATILDIVIPNNLSTDIGKLKLVIAPSIYFIALSLLYRGSDDMITN